MLHPSGLSLNATRRRWDRARPPGSAFRRRLICSPVLGIAAGEGCCREVRSWCCIGVGVSQIHPARPEIAEILNVSAPPFLQENPDPERFRKFDEEAAYRLAEIGTFEALTALILLVKKSELISSHELRSMVLNAYHHCQQWLREVPEIAPIAEELFHAIDLNCKHWIYPSPEWRMEVVIFTREFP